MASDFNWLYRGTTEIFPNQPESDNPDENLEQRLLQSETPLRVKLGIDPTGTDIHLGHSIPVRKLRAFQDAGHTAVLIIGDFTAQIGDPTGKSEVRKHLTPEEVEANAKTYLDQLRPILDFDTPKRLEIRYNSEWLKDLDLSKILELLATMTVGQMLAKEGFAERYEKDQPIYLHEFMYPLMQGYDSVAVEADVELGGTDQKFNIAVGRDLQRYFKKRPQFGLLTPILIGTDGVQKMSKSLNNYVGLKEDALSMYSKLEKVPDNQVKTYFELLTNLPLDQLPDNPRECQKLLGLEVTSHYHGREKAEQAKEASNVIYQGRNVTYEDSNVVFQTSYKSESSLSIVPEYSLAKIDFPVKLFYLLKLTGLCASSGEGRRQIKGGAVRLEGEKVTDINAEFESADDLTGKTLQVGKKKFVRLVT